MKTLPTKEYLKANIHLSDELIGRRYLLSATYVGTIRRGYGLNKPDRNIRLLWNDQEKEFVNEYWAGMPDILIGYAIDRSEISVRNYRYINGLKRTDKSLNSNSWKSYEKEFINTNWIDMSDKILCKVINRTAKAVKNYRYLNGLKRFKGGERWKSTHLEPSH